MKAYKEKLETPENSTGAYSIGISKRVPENGANLAFASSPGIGADNISVMAESYGNGGGNLESQLYFSNEDYLLENSEGISGIQTDTIMVTDEFSLTTNLYDPWTNDPVDISEPSPMFYFATLKNPIYPSWSVIANSVPYVYGYETRTLEQIRIDSLKDGNEELDYSDITIINSSIITIVEEDGRPVKSGYKIRLTRDESTGVGHYRVTIYNSFEENKTYKAIYTSYDGRETTEIIKNNILFTRAQSLSHMIEELESPLEGGETQSSRLMRKIYAVEPDGSGYNVYAPTEMYEIDDSVREPFEFKYRVRANIDVRYSMSYEKTMNLGVLYLNNEGSMDVRGIGKAIANEVGGFLPSYVQFINPHPPAKFYKTIRVPEDHAAYFNSDEYWEVDLSEPQDHINDYDLIIICGYGSHNLSAYNQGLSNYLLQGGKILIDNASNASLGVLDVDFGNLDPIIDYSYTYIEGNPYVLQESKNFTGEDKFKDRYYTLTGTSASLFTIYEDGFPISPQITIENDDYWTDIISYSSEKPSIGYLTHGNRGKVYLSNAGMTKAFVAKSNDDMRRLFANIIINIAEDLWLTTPWTYDRVYHIDQLFDDEVDSLGYIYDIGIDNEIIAKKVLSRSAKSYISKFFDTDIYKFNGRYYVEALEWRRTTEEADNRWQIATGVYMSGTGTTPLKPEDQIYAYATKAKSGFSVDDIMGYSKSEVNVYNDQISFLFTIRPYTYVWKNRIQKIFLPADGMVLDLEDSFSLSTLVVKKTNILGQTITLTKDVSYTVSGSEITLTSPMENGEYIVAEYSNGKIYRERLYATGENTSQWVGKISRVSPLRIETPDGEQVVSNMLTELIPKVPGDTIWSDRNNVFFEVRIGHYEFGAFNESEQRVNLRIYDKLTGEYKYSSDGESSISYSDLFGYRSVLNGDGTRELRRKAEDIILQGFTNYYSLTANKRTFALRSLKKDVIDIKLPGGLNPNENWHPRIKHINFIKDSFDRADYERWMKTLGFRYENEYISERIMEYFGEVTGVSKEALQRTSSTSFALSNRNIVASRGFSVMTYNDVTEKYEWVPEELYNLDPYEGVIAFSEPFLSDVFADYSYSEFTHSELGEDTVLSLISKLSDDGIGLSEADKEVISEAFDLIEEDLVFIYDLREYHNQPWNPMEPLKKSTNETAKYIDNNTIKVQYPNIHIDSDILDNRVAREKLERISPFMHKSAHLNILQSEDLKLEYNDNGVYLEINPEGYVVDFDNGIFVIDDTSPYGEGYEAADLYASYSYSTISIEKKSYLNSVVDMEELNRLDSYYYDVSHADIIGFDASDIASRERWAAEGYSIPKLYIKEDFKEPELIDDPSKYEIDYKRGFVRLNYEPSGRVYMSYSYSKSEKLTVADYDKNQGIIRLNEEISFNDNVFVTYFYEDDYYEYRGYRDGDRLVKLDLNPTRGHISTIPYVENNKVGYKDVSSYQLLGKSVYFYLLPYRIIKDGSIITENKATIRHTFDKEELRLIQLAHPEVIVLGSIKITNDLTVYDINVLDTRKRGGGLKDGILEKEILKTDPLSLNMWDIVRFDGLEYYANGITVIKVPESVLVSKGGRFTEEEVKTIVNKHLALGVLPIIKYYQEG